MAFNTNVFINCPFDQQYVPLQRALVFTVLSLGLNPQISVTRSSSDNRINEIINLIRQSKYSIHDISRNKPLKKNDLPRFNMPYEMGLDIGCKTYGAGQLANKMCLILDTERYHYQKVLSDISGQDIKDHGDSPERLITKVREWFAVLLKQRLPSSTVLWERHNEFLANMGDQLLSEGFSEREISEISIHEFILIAKGWLGAAK